MFENVKELPKPLGSYVVGITQTEFTYNYKDEQRDISVFIYYPADNSEDKESYPYGFPELFGNNKDNDSILKTKTHCYLDLKISRNQKDYPVIIYNHGYGCFEMINTILCSDLASCGYIVVSVGHPEDSTATRYPDGRIVKFNPKYSEEMTKETMNLLETKIKEMRSLDNSDDEKFIELGRKFFELQGCYNKRIDIWVKDTIKTADFVEKLNSGEEINMFKGKLRLDKGIALTGHSYGGSTSIQACHDDERFVCGINIDGGNFGDNYGQNIKKPFLTIGNPNLWNINRAVFINNSADAYHLTVQNAMHMGFTDYLFIGRDVENEDRLGDREPFNFRELVTTYHLRFFEKYLLKKDNKFDDLKYEDTRFYKKIAEK